MAERPLKHGTASAYIHGRCRCGACRAANAKHCREMRAKRSQKARDAVPHGHGGYTNYGCRCEICKAAHSESNAKRASHQARSLEVARNYGKQWTGAEMETLLRDDLSFAEAARLLGRSYWAIQTARQKIRGGDPVAVFLAGERDLPEPRRPAARRQPDSESA